MGCWHKYQRGRYQQVPKQEGNSQGRRDQKHTWISALTYFVRDGSEIDTKESTRSMQEESIVREHFTALFITPLTINLNPPCPFSFPRF